MKKFVLLLVPLILVGALAAPASAWGGGWSITPSPTPSVPTGQLFWVSCPAADSCMAVGTYTKPSGPGVGLAEQWNGHSWRVLPMPSPPGVAVSNLLGVSCTSGSACTAVGVANPTGSGAKTLAERWNGIRWSIQTTPSPPHGSLNAVSCTSASACTAVGASSAGTLAESWNGTRWTVQATPNPPQGGGFLSGVSCTSASACTAVGAANPFTPNATTLAERWNGTSWSLQATPNPSQGGGELLSVSCASASACTATGNSTNSSGVSVTLAAQWNGASWSLKPTPSPAGSPFSYLNSVACTSPSACTAVGAYQTSSGAFRTLAARWNGNAWHRQATPSPTGSSVLIGVACASGTACTAVGYTPAGTGVAWMLHRVPFHRSARVLALGVQGLEAPVAMHVVADVHATPLKKPLPWGGLGVAWIDQRVPFHRSASGPAPDLPTAVHADAEVQNTPFRSPPWDRLGVGWIRHRVPFQRSATAREAPVVLTLAPTAVHADVDVQATPSRLLNAVPDGLGVGRMRHAVPFHCSASVTPAPEALV